MCVHACICVRTKMYEFAYTCVGVCARMDVHVHAYVYACARVYLPSIIIDVSVL